jgi:hypothetical protein
LRFTLPSAIHFGYEGRHHTGQDDVGAEPDQFRRIFAQTREIARVMNSRRLIR